MDESRRKHTLQQLIALQTMHIDHATERGPSYLFERLQECRRRQDEVLKLSVDITQALADAKVARRSAKAAVTLANRSEDAAIFDTRYREAEDLYDQLRALETVAAASRSNLRSADSDIRLAASLIEQQIKLGEVQPRPQAQAQAPAGANDPLAAMLDPRDLQAAPPVAAAPPAAPAPPAPPATPAAPPPVETAPPVPPTPAAPPTPAPPAAPPAAPPVPPTPAAPPAPATVPAGGLSLDAILGSLG